MKRKYRLQYAPNAPLFQQKSGIMTISALSSLGCELVSDLSCDRVPIQKYAYCLFNNCVFSIPVHISNTCGTLNCVNKKHIKATYQPTKKDAEYISAYLSIDGLPALAHRFQVPEKLLSQYLTTLKK